MFFSLYCFFLFFFFCITSLSFFFFFFQAEDGIRDADVTGVQTCDLPIYRYFTAAERAKFLPAPILANQYRGQIFGVPLFIDAGVLYYRKDFLEKYGLAPPRLWPELVEQAKTILAHEQGLQLVGFSGQFKQYEGLVCNMMEYILSGGGALWDEKRMVSALHEPAALEAVR